MRENDTMLLYIYIYIRWSEFLGIVEQRLLDGSLDCSFQQYTIAK